MRVLQPGSHGDEMPSGEHTVVNAFPVAGYCNVLLKWKYNPNLYAGDLITSKRNSLFLKLCVEKNAYTLS